MTQPDKWDEIAGRIAWEEWKPSSYAMKVATALRSAYEEGERAGMEGVEAERARWERLATMAWGLADEYGNQLFRDRYAAIRAAKETKE